MIDSETPDESSDPALGAAWMVIAYRSIAEGVAASNDEELTEWLKSSTSDRELSSFILVALRNTLASLVHTFGADDQAAWFETLASVQYEHYTQAGRWQAGVRGALMEHPHE